MALSLTDFLTLKQKYEPDAITQSDLQAMYSAQNATPQIDSLALKEKYEPESVTLDDRNNALKQMYEPATDQAQQPAQDTSTQPTSDFAQLLPGTDRRRTFFGKIADKVTSLGAPSPAKSANIVALSEETGQDIQAVTQNYDQITKTLGLRQTPNTEELMGAAMKLYGPTGAGGIVSLAKGVGTYLAAQKVGRDAVIPGLVMLGQKLKGEEVKYETTQLRDLLPDKFKTLGDITEFVIYGKAASGVMGLGKKLNAALTARDAIVQKTTGIKPKSLGEPITKQQYEKVTPITVDKALESTGLPEYQPKAPQAKPDMAGNINLKNITLPEVKDRLLKLAETNPQEFTTSKVTMKQMREMTSDPNVMQALTEVVNRPEGIGGAVAFKAKTDTVSLVNKKAMELKKGDATAIKDALASVVNLRKVAAEAGRTLGTFTQPVPGQGDALGVIDGAISKYSGDPRMAASVAGLRQISAAIKNEQVVPPKLADKAYEVFLNSILYSPETQVRNILGNTAILLSAIPEKAAASTVDTMWSFATGAPRTQFYSEIPAMVKGLGKAVAGKGDVPIASGEKFTMGPGAISGAKGKAIRVPTWLLSKMDNVNKQLAGMMEKYATSVKEAKMEGLTGKKYAGRVANLRAKPSEAGKARIENEQLYRTFQNEADKIASLLMKSRKYIPGARYIYPFVKTPANIFKAAAERTPAGALIVAHRMGSKEGYGKEQISSDVGKMILGTAASTYFLNRWSRGQVTGNAPTDRRQRDRFYDQGFIPNAMKVGGTWVPLSNFEPIGTAIALTVNTVQAYAESGQEVPQDKVNDVLLAWGKTLTHAPYMDGARRIFEALESPQGKIGEMLAQTSSGIVPFSGALKFSTKLIDPTLREPDRDSILANIRDKIYSEVPGLNKMVRPKLTVFGEEIQSPRLSIIKGSEKEDKLNDEIERLGIKIDYIPKKLGQYELDKDTQDELSKLMGPKMKAAMETVVNKPNWDNVDASTQRRILDNIERKYRSAFINTLGKRKAIKQIMEAYPPGGERAEKLIQLLRPNLLFQPKEIRREYLK
jgi:hypothetical protein